MSKNASLGSPGLRFREAMQKENPLQIVGAVNANHALLARQAGFNAIYLSGGGVAAGSLGVRIWVLRHWMMYLQTFSVLQTYAICLY